MKHTCHAHECAVSVPPMFMCRPHWFSVPKAVRDAIWREYTPGQEVSKMPTLRYLAVQQLAIGFVAFKPYDEAAARICATYVTRAELFRTQAIKAGLGDPLEGLGVPEPTMVGAAPYDQIEEHREP